MDQIIVHRSVLLNQQVVKKFNAHKQTVNIGTIT